MGSDCDVSNRLLGTLQHTTCLRDATDELQKENGAADDDSRQMSNSNVAGFYKNFTS